MSKSASELVAEAKQRVENLSPEQVEEEMASGALVVDVREPAERQQAAIPGSIHAPRGMLEFYCDPSMPYFKEEFTPDQRIILHCASGGRSALAADTLKKMGFTNVAHLDGGIKAWQESGKPTEAGQA